MKQKKLCLWDLDDVYVKDALVFYKDMFDVGGDWEALFREESGKPGGCDSRECSTCVPSKEMKQV